MGRGTLRGGRGTVAIVGAAESDRVGKLPDKSALMLHAEGAAELLDWSMDIDVSVSFA